jgi:hypothetical protein
VKPITKSIIAYYISESRFFTKSIYEKFLAFFFRKKCKTIPIEGTDIKPTSINFVARPLVTALTGGQKQD